MAHITFSMTQLRAALLCAAKADIRYYLNGVLIESNGGTTRICGTNGHYLLATDYRHGDSEDWTGSFIMPRDVCELVCKGKYQTDTGFIEIESVANAGNVTYQRINGVVRVMGTAIGFVSVEGVFPDYTRVITPWEGDDTDMKAAQFNPEYIGTFSKIAKLFGSKKGFYTLWMRGDDGALVTFGSLPDNVNATGVLMPIRTKACDLKIPCTTQFRTKLTVEAKEPTRTSDVEA